MPKLTAFVMKCVTVFKTNFGAATAALTTVREGLFPSLVLVVPMASSQKNQHRKGIFLCLGPENMWMSLARCLSIAKAGRCQSLFLRLPSRKRVTSAAREGKLQGKCNFKVIFWSRTSSPQTPDKTMECAFHPTMSRWALGSWGALPNVTRPPRRAVAPSMAQQHGLLTAHTSECTWDVIKAGSLN